MLIALASVKGSPGTTTTARALAAVWPGGALLVDADPAGGDVALTSRTVEGLPLDPDVGLLSLSVEARRGLPDVAIHPHVQVTDAGLPVLCGIARPEQVAGLGPVWPAVASILSRANGTVVADLGRLAPGTPVLPLAHAADAVVLLTRPRLESYAHLRERLAWLRDTPPTSGPLPPVGVLLVTDARDTRAAADLGKLLAHDGFDTPVLGIVADDAKAADVLAGRIDRGIDRSLLVRSVRRLVGPVADLASTRVRVPQGAAGGY